MKQVISSAMSFLKYSTSDKRLSTEEINKWRDTYDVRRGEILEKMSISEIEIEFTTFFTTYSFPSAQHKQIVKRSLQRIIPKIFPGFGCDIQGNYIIIRKIEMNESINIRGKIEAVSNNASIFASSPSNVKTNYCKNCNNLERKINELEQIIKMLSLSK